MASERQRLPDLLAEVRGCTVCAERLPDGPRPVVQFGSTARIVIIGHAPGRRVHASGIPWDDRSGDRLREWLGVDHDTFYDPRRIAIMPMGFCYPGSTPSGDAPPRPECAPLWHDRLLAQLEPDPLLVILGAHAVARYVPERRRTLADTVAMWQQFLPDRLVMPHPSPRNQRWLAKHRWFELEVLPQVRQRVAEVLAAPVLP